MDDHTLLLLEEIQKIEVRSKFGFTVITEDDRRTPNILDFLMDRVPPARLKEIGLTDCEKKLLDKRYFYKKAGEIFKRLGFGIIMIVC